MEDKISVIIPFYKGNDCIQRALDSIYRVRDSLGNRIRFEVIIVNDSPEVAVKLQEVDLDCKIIQNKENYGIHKSRVNGLKEATGEYIQFLDQDDELVLDGYMEQLTYMQNSDIVVGNGDYRLGEKNSIIFQSLSTMKYLICYEKLLKIRNLIPSPGECLIRKSAIPDEWISHTLKIDGADDWMLWIAMFRKGARFSCNPQKVYIHNDANGANCSANLEQMRNSAHEANGILRELGILTDRESNAWGRAIEFKFLQDTGQLTIVSLIKYCREILNNVVYKINVYIKDRDHIE